MPSYTKLLLTSTVVATSLFLAGCSTQSPETSSEVTPAEQMTVEATSAPAAGTSEETKITPTAAAGSDAMTTDGKELTTIEKYQTPAGEEQVGFTLVVDDAGVITDAKTEVMAKAPISVTRQNEFQKNIAAAVKGKKLVDLMKVDRVGGSSLTTGAFNKALTALKEQM